MLNAHLQTLLRKTISGSKTAYLQFLSTPKNLTCSKIGQELINFLSNHDLKECDALTLWHAAHIYARLPIEKREDHAQFVSRLLDAARANYAPAIAALLVLHSYKAIFLTPSQLMDWQNRLKLLSRLTEDENRGILNLENHEISLTLALFHLLNNNDEHVTYHHQQAVMLLQPLADVFNDRAIYYLGWLHEKSCEFIAPLDQLNKQHLIDTYEFAAQLTNPEAYGALWRLLSARLDEANPDTATIEKYHQLLKQALNCGNTDALKPYLFLLAKQLIYQNKSIYFRTRLLLSITSDIEVSTNKPYHELSILLLLSGVIHNAAHEQTDKQISDYLHSVLTTCEAYSSRRIAAAFLADMYLQNRVLDENLSFAERLAKAKSVLLLAYKSTKTCPLLLLIDLYSSTLSVSFSSDETRNHKIIWLYELAAEEKDPCTLFNFARFYEKEPTLTSQVILDRYFYAAALYERAAVAGNSDAYYALCCLYQNNLIGSSLSAPQREATIFRYLKKGADANNSRCIAELGHLYMTRKLPYPPAQLKPQIHYNKKAVDLYRKSIDVDPTNGIDSYKAIVNLVMMYAKTSVYDGGSPQQQLLMAKQLIETHKLNFPEILDEINRKLSGATSGSFISVANKTSSNEISVARMQRQCLLLKATVNRQEKTIRDYEKQLKELREQLSSSQGSSPEQSPVSSDEEQQGQDTLTNDATTDASNSWPRLFSQTEKGANGTLDPEEVSDAQPKVASESARAST